jgi:DNA-binding response OmpR family regulator
MAKILIVEDDKEARQSLIEWLNLEKHLVEAVESGADAIQLLTNFSYELIILDWGLPDMSGPTVLSIFFLGENSNLLSSCYFPLIILGKI